MFKDENRFNGTTVTHLHSYMLPELERGCQEFVHTVYSLWATAWDSLDVGDVSINLQSFPGVRRAHIEQTPFQKGLHLQTWVHSGHTCSLQVPTARFGGHGVHPPSAAFHIKLQNIYQGGPI